MSGLLSGIPSGGGIFSFVVSLLDANNIPGATSYTLKVNPPTLTLSPTGLPNANVGTTYSETIVATGGTSPYTYRVVAGALPAGISLNASTGVLSGTPSRVGVYHFTISATDSSTGTGPYTTSRSYVLHVTHAGGMVNSS